MSRPVALITGGALRLGAHLARCLADDGWDVAVNYRSSAAEAEALAAELRGRGGNAWALQADVSRRGDVAAMFASLAEGAGRLDLLLNNVGIYEPKPLSEVTPDDWDHAIGANLSGSFYCVHAALPLLREGGGNIITIGYAGLDALTAAPEAAPYQVSKVGMLVLTKALAKELAPEGVRANMISPGQLENSVDLPDDPATALPAGRAGTLDDIAGALRYLLGADYVTGVNIDVAGGYRL
ncbi:MAG: SDR family oxidoreductase [Deltaproteobacteria bacterium]|nr:SDR family oxidoreductase [Deltaproteobacteria bacterium]